MTITKLRIDLTQGIVEVEGDSSFVQAVYEDFRERLLSETAEAVKTPIRAKTKKKSPAEPKDKKEAGTSTKKKKNSGGSASGSIVKDLDLSGGAKGERLKDFYNSYKLASNMERNLVFVYYLQHTLAIENITLDHVFTCYRDVGVKVPAALQQSLWDTTNRKGWLDTSSSENITVTVPGMNYLKHDMAASGTE